MKGSIDHKEITTHRLRTTALEALCLLFSFKHASPHFQEKQMEATEQMFRLTSIVTFNLKHVLGFLYTFIMLRGPGPIYPCFSFFHLESGNHLLSHLATLFIQHWGDIVSVPEGPPGLSRMVVMCEDGGLAGEPLMLYLQNPRKHNP